MNHLSSGCVNTMAELEPGHPDELVQTLTNWLKQAHSGEGVLLPPGIDPTEWAVRRFIDSWQGPARRAIESIEQSLDEGLELCEKGAPYGEVVDAIENARSTLQEDLRDHFGLYGWNKQSDDSR